MKIESSQLKSGYPLFCVIIASIVTWSLGWIPLLNVFLIGIFAIAITYFVTLKRTVNDQAIAILWVFLVFIGLIIGMYRPAAFNYPQLFSVSALHEGGKEFTQYLNVSKMLAGYMVLAAFAACLAVQRTWRYTLIIPVCMGGVAMVIFMATVMLGLQWHVKEARFIVLFAFSNLLVTCVSEEAFMRLIFQEQIEQTLIRYTKKARLSAAIALALSSILFVLSHGAFSGAIGLVYALAGLFYGVVYMVSRNIYLTILVHFLVNIIHFSFLTYPIV